MNTMKDGFDQPGGLEESGDRALWDLLGALPPPTVSPYFSRRVLRATIRVEEERGPVLRWLRRLALPHPAWSGALAAGLVGVVSLSVAFHHSHVRQAAAIQKDARDDLSARDVEVIADLDNLLAYEENRIWTDESNSD